VALTLPSPGVGDLGALFSIPANCWRPIPCSWWEDQNSRSPSPRPSPAPRSKHCWIRSRRIGNRNAKPIGLNEISH